MGSTQHSDQPEKLRKFVIDRAIWRCGGTGPYSTGDEVDSPTYLRNAQGKQCCLGSVCRQLGVPPYAIVDVSRPLTLIDVYRDALVADGLLLKREPDHGYISSTLALAAVKINDDECTDAKEKEALLTALFKEHGAELTFTGEYPDYVHFKPQGIVSKFYTDNAGAPAGGNTIGIGMHIEWQNGPLVVDGGPVPRNGAFVEDVLAALIQRIEYYQTTKYANESNTEALNALIEAQEALAMRIALRKRSGKLGTGKV